MTFLPWPFSAGSIEEQMRWIEIRKRPPGRLRDKAEEKLADTIKERLLKARRCPPMHADGLPAKYTAMPNSPVERVDE